MTINDMMRNALVISLESVFKEAIENTEDVIVGFNTGQLYNKGEDSEGDKLLSYSSTTYALEKEAMNPNPGFFNPDLYYTGDFHKSFLVDATEEDFSIWATDEKTESLVEKYGEAIFGLQDINLSIFVEEDFAEEFIKVIKQQLEG